MASYTTIRDYLRQRAAWVWNAQSLAYRHGLTLQEETLTEMLLLRMAQDHAAHGLTVTLFNKRTEKFNGADWEWIIQTPDCVIGLRVQAKRLYYSGSWTDYAGLKPSSSQVDKLINKAGSFTPVYVFYNHGHGTNSGLLKAEDTPSPDHDSRFWGCSVASAHAVRTAKSNRLKDLLKIMRPWHHLVTETGTCGVHSVLGFSETPGLALESLSPRQVVEQIKNQKFMLDYLSRKKLAGVAVIASPDFRG